MILDPAQAAATVDSIAAIQLPNGMIPWFPGGHADPWNHVEAAMALTLGGHHAAARQAYLKLLIWDIAKAPLVTRAADRLLNPVLGKSLVVYAEKPC